MDGNALSMPDESKLMNEVMAEDLHDLREGRAWIIDARSMTSSAAMLQATVVSLLV